MRNPERTLISELSEKLTKEKLFAKMEEVLRENPPLDPRNFRDLYGGENVDRDTAYVEEMERRFREEASTERTEWQKIAKVLEVIIAEHIELSDWLGPDAVTIIPSRYDDIANGVDLVTEFQNEEERKASHMALAVDVTSGSDLGKKMERIKEEILHGEIARVKYFESEFLGIRGELRNIPRVVVGVDRRALDSLGELWLAHDTKTLARHEVQRVILEEIRAELAAFAAYARKERRENVAAVYERALQTVEKIIEEKEGITISNLANDAVFRAIIRETERFAKGH